MNDVMLILYRVRYRLGMAGLAGVLAAVCAMAIYLFAVLPAERQVQAGEAQVRHLRAHPQGAAVAQPSRSGDSAALSEFYGQFPPMARLPELLGTLHALAHEHGIAIPRGDFKFANNDGEKLLRYEITLPVKCSYLQLRNFIDAAAHKLPTLGLNEISIKREAVGDDMVQARLGFILYLSEN